MLLILGWRYHCIAWYSQPILLHFHQNHRESILNQLNRFTTSFMWRTLHAAVLQKLCCSSYRDKQQLDDRSVKSTLISHINSWNDLAICLTSSAQHTGFHWISLDQAFVEQEVAWGDLRSFWETWRTGVPWPLTFSRISTYFDLFLSKNYPCTLNMVCHWNKWQLWGGPKSLKLLKSKVLMAKSDESWWIPISIHFQRIHICIPPADPSSSSLWCAGGSSWGSAMFCWDAHDQDWLTVNIC